MKVFRGPREGERDKTAGKRAECRGRTRPHCKGRKSRLMTDMVPACSTCYRARAATRHGDALTQENREESWEQGEGGRCQQVPEPVA